MKPTRSGNPRLEGEESLFSRDLDGHLVRLDKVTVESLKDEVTVAIDERAIRVKRAFHAADTRGNLLYDEKGGLVLRATTIFDAASMLVDAVPLIDAEGRPVQDEKGRVVHRPRTENDPRPKPDELAPNPIPVLCHLPHQDPVAVCRACVVEISRIKRGKPRTERKLLPACQHRVEKQMEVKTIATSERVETAVKVVVELLVADHPSPCLKEQRDPGACELESLAARLGVARDRFQARRPARPRDLDQSSLLILVDHAACILCDRCVRGCNEIKNNQVIGRMNKGYGTRISFDLDALMGNSSCVSCGECMVSCPTGALVFREAIASEVFQNLDPPAQTVDLDYLLKRAHPEIRRAFAHVSPIFLDWNLKSVVLRKFPPGHLICRQGEYGSTAFFLDAGTAEIEIVKDRDAAEGGPGGSFLGRLFGRAPTANEDRDQAPRRRFIPVDAPVVLPADKPHAMLGEGDLFGEMACLNSYPRGAAVRAGKGGCTVLEMQRNVLDVIRRSRAYREEMDRKYRDRVVKNMLRTVRIFEGLNESLIDELSRSASYRRCEPGEVIVRQGERALGGGDESEGLFLIRAGFVQIAVGKPGGKAVLTYRGPGNHIGEIGLISGLPAEVLDALGAGMGPEVAEIRRVAGTGVRIATCTALDHVELVRIGPEAFQAVLPALTDEVRKYIITSVSERLRETLPSAFAPVGERRGPAEPDAQPGALRSAQQGDFQDQGLYGAQSVLVLDLLKCTRCDECTKACSDTHGGVTRLIREGLRFDKYLVASSCRSCHDPVCLIGCPVDAIHRRPKSNEIWIENTCIGCGKCAENCPYGNINMHELPGDKSKAGAAAPVGVAYRATTCDQCHSLNGHEPNCVVACPHDAAHRMKGDELLSIVQGRVVF